MIKIFRSSWYVQASLLINVLLAGYLIFHWISPSGKGGHNNANGDQEGHELIKPTSLENQVMLIDGKTQPLSKSIDKSTNFDNILFRLSNDDDLELVKYPSKEFHASKLKHYLHSLPLLSIFILVDFNNPIDFYGMNRIEESGFATIKPKNEYFNKTLGLFYGKFKSLRSLGRSATVKNIYILKTFTAKGNYRLHFIPEADADNLEVSFHLPFSKNGRKLLHRTVSLGGLGSKFDQNSEEDILQMVLDVKKKKRITLFTKLTYKIDMEELLEHHVRVVGQLTVGEYIQKMSGHPDYQMFTSTSEKIVFSDYIDQLASQISPTNRVLDVWHYISKKLDEDITYDSRKRFEFFNGLKVYDNIKDMYMTAAQLGEAKVGACPERSSLETAILRRMGIASRTATRLYHIYTEILLPERGWVTTSGLLKEIPLVDSKDEKQSYFVSWSPNHPIRLKWEGGLYPLILY